MPLPSFMNFSATDSYDPHLESPLLFLLLHTLLNRICGKTEAISIEKQNVHACDSLLSNNSDENYQFKTGGSVCQAWF